MHQGLFIAVEGSDGSGKGTQFKLLTERLKAAGYDVSTYDFPQYDQESSYYVRQYLNGKYGSAEAVGPYTPSVFYALDRFSAAHTIADDLAAGKVVLSNRFTGSSMAHQGTKFTTPQERETFFRWIEQLEHNMLGIPKPDINIVLVVPADISQKLIDQKDARSYTTNKRDLHEADINHLKRAVETFEQLTDTYESFSKINCSKDGELLSIPSINNKIWERIEPMLGRLRKQHTRPVDESHNNTESTKSEQPSSVKDNPPVPPTLPKDLAAQFNNHYLILKKTRNHLSSYLSKGNGDTLELIMPVSDLEPQNYTPRISELVKTNGLQPIKGNDDSMVELIDYWPKNENEIIPQIVYSHSTLDLTEISNQVSRWTYDTKVEVLKQYLDSSSLSQVTYHFEFITSYALYHQLTQYGTQLRQSLSPYYGFDDTEDLEDTTVESLVTECYQSSMDLYQATISAGYTAEAQYACLAGHKLRWQLTINAHELHKLMQQLSSSHTKSSAKVHAAINAVLTEAHPIVAAAL